MELNEFTPEILRLYRGFNAQNELTAERLEALFAGLSHHPVGVLRDAVTAALRDPKLPWFDKLSELVEREAEADRKAESRRMDEDARRFLRPGWENIRPASNPEWASVHHRALILTLDGKREEARQLLAAINSPADLTRTVPLDGGAWLEANGAMFGLRAPAAQGLPTTPPA